MRVIDDELSYKGRRDIQTVGFMSRADYVYV